jgi:restriction system protein
VALWLVRGGRHGQHEDRFFATQRIYLTWDELRATNLSGLKDYKDVRALIDQTYPNEGVHKRAHWAGQIWAFVLAMKPGDWVVTPRKGKAAIAVGKITGPYKYDEKGDPGYRHWRSVEWLNTDVPRTAFGQDLLYSFGATMTICEIKKNNAEARVKALAASGWKSEATKPIPSAEDAQPDTEPVDLARIGRDQIAALILKKYKGHGMARLVEGVLKAQGYSTFRSPEGPDSGVDILAAPGPLGFDQPRICVQVKSSDSPVDTATLHQLLGSMQNVGASQGLLVSWGGFKSSVDKQEASHFFRVRLWDQEEFVKQLLHHYDRLDEDLRAELPLKRIWTVAESDEEND